MYTALQTYPLSSFTNLQDTANTLEFLISGKQFQCPDSFQLAPSEEMKVNLESVRRLVIYDVYPFILSSV